MIWAFVNPSNIIKFMFVLHLLHACYICSFFFSFSLYLYLSSQSRIQYLYSPQIRFLFVSTICHFFRYFVLLYKYCLELDICSKSMDNKSNNCLLFVQWWQYKRCKKNCMLYGCWYFKNDFCSHLFYIKFLFRRNFFIFIFNSFVIKFSTELDMKYGIKKTDLLAKLIDIYDWIKQYNISQWEFFNWKRLFMIHYSEQLGFFFFLIWIFLLFLSLYAGLVAVLFFSNTMNLNGNARQHMIPFMKNIRLQYIQMAE